MSKPTTKYPEDEFDRVDPDAAPAGAHRAPRSRWSRTAPYLIVVAVSAALAVGLVYYYSQSPTSRLNADPTPSVSAEPTAPTEGTEPDAGEVTGVETPDATEPTEPVEPEVPVEPETPVEPPAPVADTATPVRVLNATSRQGVAAGAAETLAEAGWTDVVADNFTGTRPSGSLVYYKDADSEDEAREVAQLLGITEVLEAPNLVGPVSVVLAGSFGS